MLLSQDIYIINVIFNFVKKLVSGRIYQCSCSGITNRLLTRANPTTIPIIYMFDLIFSFHIS